MIPATVTHYHIQGVYTKHRLSGWIQGRRSPSNPEYSSGRLPRYLPPLDRKSKPVHQENTFDYSKGRNGSYYHFISSPLSGPYAGQTGQAVGATRRGYVCELIDCKLRFCHTFDLYIHIYIYIYVYYRHDVFFRSCGWRLRTQAAQKTQP